MGKQTSPFDALTPREQQERWLEFQSTRLPYIAGNVDGEPDKPKPEPKPAPASAPQAKTPARTDAQANFNRARHHQYDSVIQKMRQAEQKLTAYQRVVE